MTRRRGTLFLEKPYSWLYIPVRVDVFSKDLFIEIQLSYYLQITSHSKGLPLLQFIPQSPFKTVCFSMLHIPARKLDSPHLCVGFLFLILYPASSSAVSSASAASASGTHHFDTHYLSHTTLSPTISHTQLCHTPSCHTHHLSHTIFDTPLSHTIFHPTIFHTQLCHTPSCHTPSLTHHFHTHYLSHTTLSPTIFHTQLCHIHNFVTHNFVTHHLSTPPWHLVTSIFVLRGRRGPCCTWWHLSTGSVRSTLW